MYITYILATVDRLYYVHYCMLVRNPPSIVMHPVRILASFLHLRAVNPSPYIDSRAFERK